MTIYVLSVFTFLAAKDKKYNFSVINILFLFLIMSLNIINTFFIHSNLFSGVTFLLGVLSILNLFLDSKYSARLIWCFIFLLLRLPVKEYFQIFLGVPIRLLSANVIENAFNLFNINSINQSSILIFENNITNIDYPCSGIATIYYTLLFISIIGIIKPVKINLKSTIAILICCLTAVFFNILRIFILILFSFTDEINFIGDKIHIAIGIINYLIICFIFLFMTKKPNEKECNKTKLKGNYLIILLISIILCIPVLSYKDSAKTNTEFKIIHNPQYKNLELSEQEKSLFSKHNAEVEKYFDGKNIIIKIKSSDFKALHNPEICLKNQGFKIYSSTTQIIDSKIIRKLITNKGFIYYWFTNGKMTTDDYYKKVFDSIFSEFKVWTLIIVYSGTEIETLDI